MPLPALTDLLPLLALGGALGFFGGLFGIGGGVIAIPLFVLVFGMAQPLAQGTALVLMVPNLLVAWWRYQQRHPVAVRALLAIGLSAGLTTAVVAHWAARLDPLLLRVLFGLALGMLALRLLLVPGLPAGNPAPLDWRRLPLIGVIGGSCMGLLGIGGGLVATPLLAGWLGQRQSVAQSLSLALVAPSALVALATYAAAGRVDWGYGLPLAAGGLLTVAAGVGLAHRLPEARLRAAFAWMLLATAGWLLVAPLRR